MKAIHAWRAVLAGVCAALTAITLVATSAPAVDNGVAAVSNFGVVPIVSTASGTVRGVAVSGGYEFLGLPYAAPPTGNLRWRPPQPPAGWKGIRDATQFAPSCPQPVSPFLPPGPLSDDCLYLNVYTPTLRGDTDRPVLVWIHGGGFTEDGARNYDGSKLAADGTVVVTINYRLGALGFLAHPALATRPGGPAGNYGLMDQQAALRWVQRNIAHFGGDPHNVTIAGQSAGGVSVLAQLVSRGSRGLFERAIVQSGAFALTQEPLPEAEAAGEAFANSVGCENQSAECLRQVSVSDLANDLPGSAIPGVIDGKVLTESIGTALAAGRFAHVPILNGVNHIEELIFTAGLGVAVSGGTFVGLPVHPVTPDGYTTDIAAVLGVSNAQATVVAARYPLGSYPTLEVAFATLVSDANFACPALQVDRWISRRVPTFAYQFNDDNAPERFAPLPPAATHSSELQYIFDQPNAPIPGTLNADQQVLAGSMRAAWASFAAEGNPSTPALAWPLFNQGEQVMSLAPPDPQVWTGFSDTHQCAFWATLR
ncbi:MAG TPA: carboxylesterase family protein [Solirubrobacteraceae bacterium]|nr:carboxylesterase family protein [Solirubrobacteraceae bacterium]